MNRPEVPKEQRKAREAELHDHLRRDLGDDPELLENKKWYSIDRASRQRVRSRLAELATGKRVLDYCCGSGERSIEAAEIAGEVVGIDISAASIDIARERATVAGATNVEFIVGDAEASGFPEDHFDVALVSGVLHHLDLERAYCELARVLKPGGTVIATEALRHNPVIHRYRRRTPHLRSEWEVEHILGWSDIRKAERYFGQVEVLGCYHLASIAAVPFRRRPSFPRLLRMLEHVDSVILRLPGLRWMAWMVVFELRRPRPAVWSAGEQLLHRGLEECEEGGQR